MKRVAWLSCAGIACAVTIATNSYTNSRLASTALETRLTPFNVGRLAKTGTYATDSDVYAQPLYLPARTVAGGTHNILVVATMHNSVYLFDADLPGSAALISVNLGANQAAGTFTGNSGTLLYNREMGCAATPVADTTNARLYLSCATGTTWKLWELNLDTLATINSVVMTGTAGGKTFCYACQMSRGGLAQANGNIYIPFGSMADNTLGTGNWYGWILAYDQATLAQTGVFCSTCAGGTGGGIWQSGGGISVDGSGNIYAVTGNGTGTVGATNLNESVIKLDASLAVQDWYAPADYATLNTNDWDLASGRPMLIPSTTLLVFGAKDFKVYSVDTACMGNIGGGNNGCTPPQVFATGSDTPTDHQGVYGCMFLPALNRGYFPNTAGNLYGYALTGSTWNTTPTISAAVYGFPGAQITGTSDAGSNPLIWAVAPVASALNSAQQGVLYALDAVTLTARWSSATNSGRDAPGQIAKFNPPTIASGRVYLGTLDSGVQVYGVADAPTSNINGPLILTGPGAVK